MKQKKLPKPKAAGRGRPPKPGWPPKALRLPSVDELLRIDAQQIEAAGATTPPGRRFFGNVVFSQGHREQPDGFTFFPS